MIGHGIRLWSAAFLVSVCVHVGLFIGFKPLTSGTSAKPAGATVSLSGTLAGVLGTITASEPAKTNEAKPVNPATTAIVEAVKLPLSPQRKVSKPVATAVSARTPATAAIAPIESAEPIESLKPPQTPLTKPVKAAILESTQEKAKAKHLKERAKPASRKAKKKRKSKSAARQRVGGKHQGNAGASRGRRRGKSRASAGAISSYGARVRARILANRPSAFGQGRVSISFAISRSGSLRYASVIRSSGIAGLDRAALAAVRRSSPFPSPPSGAGASQLRFSIPFSFR